MFGPGAISPTQLLIVFGIVILIFGTAKLKNFGSDLGGALKGFKKAMSDDESVHEPSSRQVPKIEPGKTDSELSGQAEVQRQD